LNDDNGVDSLQTRRTYLRCAFTLIELLIVISIIALLLAIMVPTLSKARSISRRTACQSNLKQIDYAIRVYAQNNQEIYPCAQDPVSTDPYCWLWMGRGWRAFVAPYIGGHIDANNPGVLLCPEDKTSPQKYESTSYSYSMAFYHSPGQIDDMNSIQQTYSNPVDSIPQRLTSVAHPSQKILIGEWLSNHLRLDEGPDPGWWGWDGQRNFLLADGHIEFIEAEDILKANDGNPNPNLTASGISGIDYLPER
jgi:prepilin-type N-terminal cleavage/methylation domain-containing protein/prepilin-type processing-associated H-X9-DG protein